MKLLSEKIEEFIEWLKLDTDFGDWHPNVQDRVHKKLIECMTNEKPAEPKCECNFNRADKRFDRTNCKLHSVSMDNCFLDVDSPSYPPTETEYWQCRCKSCIEHLKKLEPRTAAGSLD